jgi:serine/threonine protein kinase
VFFIDFGIAQSFVDPSKGCHREEAEAGAVVGTPSYVSLAVHNGTIPARRDDVEAVGLVLLCMLGRGSLPWSSATSEAECKALKNSTDIHALASR